MMGYIDPNTGGMLFQALAIAFAAFSGLVLLLSRQIRTAVAGVKRYIRERFNREEATD